MSNILIALLVALAGPAIGAPVMQHATGTFDVKLAPPVADTRDGVAIGRMTIDKVYAGPLAATSRGEMMTATGPVEASAAYVLIERVTGTLDGKAGSFALAHLGIMDRGAPNQRVVVVPDSGTGALAGISGTMTIQLDGAAHFYDLRYRITPR